MSGTKASSFLANSRVAWNVLELGVCFSVSNVRDLRPSKSHEQEHSRAHKLPYKCNDVCIRSLNKFTTTPIYNLEKRTILGTATHELPPAGLRGTVILP